MSKKVEMTAIITAKDGVADNMECELKILEDKTLSENGCVEFKFFRDKDNENRFVLWEIFDSDEALKSHLDKDYTVDFFSKKLSVSTEVIKHRKI